MLSKRVRIIDASSRETQCVKGVHVELSAAAGKNGRNGIAWLMRVAGLVCANRRCTGVTTTRRDKDARPAPDLGEASLRENRGFNRQRGRATQIHYYLYKKTVGRIRGGSMIVRLLSADEIHLDLIEGCGR